MLCVVVLRDAFSFFNFNELPFPCVCYLHDPLLQHKVAHWATTIGVECLLCYYFVVEWCVPHVDCGITVMIMPCGHLRCHHVETFWAWQTKQVLVTLAALGEEMEEGIGSQWGIVHSNNRN